MNESLSGTVSKLISAIDLKLLFLLVIGFVLIMFGVLFFDLGALPFGLILMFLGAVVLGISYRIFWVRVGAFKFWEIDHQQWVVLMVCVLSFLIFVIVSVLSLLS